jgi:type II secretion system protein I
MSVEDKCLKRSHKKKAALTCLPAEGEGGFTLLEVLVALAILGIAVTTVFQLFSSNLRAISVSENYVSASVAAGARMREMLDREDLAVGSWNEITAEGYAVDVSVAEVLQERTKDLSVQVLEVVLTLQWRKDLKGKTLTLRSMKTIERKI